jgi:hypothetical protein
MLICVLHQPMDAEIDTQHPTWRINLRGISHRWLGGRSLHNTRSIGQVFVGAVYDVSSYLYDICCGSDCL